MSEKNMRLIVVSNRLPVALKKQGDEWTITPGSGGLVTALAPVLRDRGGTWVGWSGAPGDADVDAIFSKYSEEAGYNLLPIHLEEQEVKDYYAGFSNSIIWPLFHDFQSRCDFDPAFWRAYLDVNFKFAETLAKNSTPDDYMWVHDYHLMHVAFFLKSIGLSRKTGFFLHIPFPAPDIFLKLPWRLKIIHALLDFDMVGFQTMRDRRNFALCVKALVPDAKVRGRGAIVTVEAAQRKLMLGSFPISIDYNDFADIAKDAETAEMSFEIKQALRHRKILLGVDRLDYTKGIPQRLEGIRQALIRYPALRGRINFIQILVPSREDVEEYKDLKTEIETLVGQINGQFTIPGWVPVHYQYRNLARQELVAYYRAADIALVTPLRDGMNLVAKEYCATNVPETGVLILSEFAGAAAQLQRYGACLVNPYDVDGVARAIHRAFFWDNEERKRRMQKMRDVIRRNNIYWWVDSFLQPAFSSKLDDFPVTGTVAFHRKA